MDRLLVEVPKERRRPRRPSFHGCSRDIMKPTVAERGCSIVEWIGLAQDMDKLMRAR